MITKLQLSGGVWNDVYLGIRKSLNTILCLAVEHRTSRSVHRSTTEKLIDQELEVSDSIYVDIQ